MKVQSTKREKLGLQYVGQGWAPGTLWGGGDGRWVEELSGSEIIRGIRCHAQSCGL